MLGKPLQVDVEEDYFSTDIDCSTKEIDAILSATPLDLKAAAKRRHVLQRQLEFVTRKASQIILDRQQSYAVELKRVLELEECLGEAKTECHNARSYLGAAKSVLTERGLYLLANCRHRMQLLVLLKALVQIRCIRGTSSKLAEFLDANDYSAAIELGIACQKESSSLAGFECLKDTASKLQDALQSVEEMMDSALSKHCTHFDPETYSRLQDGYSLLGPGKLQVAADQLIMHTANTLQDRCHSVLAGYAALTQLDGDTTGDAVGSFNVGRPFIDVCRLFAGNTDPSIVIAGVKDCAQACWQILSNYLRLYHWHMNRAETQGSPLATGDEEKQALKTAEGYVKTKLNLGRSRIWQEVDGRIRVLLGTLMLDQFHSENFLQLLDVVRVLPLCGKWFADCESPGIAEATSNMSSRFFKTFHLKSLEECRMFFENEFWTLCPLPLDYTIWSLPELANLEKKSEKSCNDQSIDFDLAFEEDSSPFINCAQRSTSSSMNGNGTQNAMPIVDDGNGPDDPNQYASVANVTFAVIRLMAQYTCLLQPLSAVSMDVISGIAELYDQYLFSIYQSVKVPCGFAQLPQFVYPKSQRLTGTIQRIQSQKSNSTGINVLSATGPGCANRILAAESVVFLSAQMEKLKPMLEKHVPQQKTAFLTQFFAQSVKAGDDIRPMAYFSIGSSLIEPSQLLQKITSVNFEPKEIQAEHSPYIEWIIQCIAQRMENITKSVKESMVPFPKGAKQMITSAALRCATYYLVDGYCQVKKCNNEGRALMKLDVESLSNMAERKLSSKPPLPGREMLDSFIVAFYLRDDTELEAWIKEHREFSPTQLQGLINQLPWLTAKSRRRLTEFVQTAPTNSQS